MIPVNHSVPGVGYRIQNDTGSFAFSGDTTTNDSLWEVLNRHDELDMLVIECAFSNSEKQLSDLAGHYCPETLIADMSKLRHRPRVFITHLKPGEEDQTFQEITDGLTGFDVVRLHSEDHFQL
jgi:ribonuclease BN (tRNA processing enzyme)